MIALIDDSSQALTQSALSDYDGTGDPVSYSYTICAHTDVLKEFTLLSNRSDYDWLPRREIVKYYRRLIANIFNIYPAILYRRQAFSKSGFIGKVAKRRKG